MMNRKEFKQLLNEWNQNFINEKVELSLQSHVEGKIRDFVVVFVEDANPDFRNKLKQENIDHSVIGDNFISCKGNKEEVVNFILDEENKNFKLDSENVMLLVNNYLKEDPILITSGGDSGGFSDVGQGNTKEACLEWAIHDLFHLYYRLGHSFVNLFNNEAVKDVMQNKYKELFVGESYDFENFDLDNLMDHDERYMHSEINYEDKKLSKSVKLNIIEEFMTYFQQKPFTKGVDSFDIIPSIFSYCITKMPSPDDVEGLKAKLVNSPLSVEAKIYLLMINIVADKQFEEEIIPNVKNSILFIDYNLV